MSDRGDDFLERIAGALESIVKPNDSEAIKAEAVTLKGDVMALMSVLRVGGENVGKILDDESLNLMEKHRELRTLGTNMVAVADRHTKKLEQQGV